MRRAARAARRRSCRAARAVKPRARWAARGRPGAGAGRERAPRRFCGSVAGDHAPGSAARGPHRRWARPSTDRRCCAAPPGRGAAAAGRSAPPAAPHAPSRRQPKRCERRGTHPCSPEGAPVQVGCGARRGRGPRGRQSHELALRSCAVAGGRGGGAGAAGAGAAKAMGWWQRRGSPSTRGSLGRSCDRGDARGARVTRGAPGFGGGQPAPSKVGRCCERAPRALKTRRDRAPSQARAATGRRRRRDRRRHRAIAQGFPARHAAGAADVPGTPARLPRLRARAGGGRRLRQRARAGAAVGRGRGPAAAGAGALLHAG
jgi:hypothetical protein